MKLTYWYSKCPDDSDVYSVRARTRKEARAFIADRDDNAKWPEPVRVDVEYDDAFDLMSQCSHEDHHWWEVA
jgi:hypothetical protein